MKNRFGAATGTFDVKLVPQPSDNKAEDAVPARMTIDKQFHGDLEGTSKGQMLAAGTTVKGRPDTSRSSRSAARCTAGPARSSCSTAAP